MPRKVIPVGYRFPGTTLSYVRDAEWSHIRMLVCACDCGNEITTSNKHLVSGSPSSCGCQRKRLIGSGQRTHGKFGTSVYSIYHSMLARCLNPKHIGFKHYGGRGITVCDRWQNSFENFYEDMGDRPTSKHSIDRIDVDGDYCPENCRWATHTRQCNNKRNNVRTLYNGELLTYAELSVICGLPRQTIRDRLLLGWSVEDAMYKPVQPCKRKKISNG